MIKADFEYVFLLVLMLLIPIHTVWGQYPIPSSVIQSSHRISNWQRDNTFNLATFNQDNGLPFVSINAMDLGADGHIYCASTDGIIHFDGNSFELLPKSIVGNSPIARILNVTALPDTSLFLEAENYVAFWLKNDIAYELHTDSSQRNQPIHFYVSPSGIIYAANSQWVFRFNKTTKRLEQLAPMPFHNNLFVLKILSNEDFVLWNDAGLWLYQQHAFVLKLQKNQLPIQLQQFNGIQELSSNSLVMYSDGFIAWLNSDYVPIKTFVLSKNRFKISRIAEIDSTNWTIYTWSGVFNLNPYSDTAYLISLADSVRESPIRTINHWANLPVYAGSNKVIWGNQTLVETKSLSITSVLVDAWNQLWIAVSGEGLYRFTLNPFKHLGPEQGFPAQNIYSFTQEKEIGTWVSTFDSGVILLKDTTAFVIKSPNELSRFTYRTKEHSLLGGFHTANVHFLLPESNTANVAWMTDFPSYYDVGDYFSTLQNAALTIHTQHNGTLWLGTQDHLLKLVNKESTFTEVTHLGNPIKGVRVICPITDSEKMLLGTSHHGMWLADSMHIVPIEDYRLPRNIRDLYFDEQDLLWIASEDAALTLVENFWSNNRTVYSITHSSPIPKRTIHRIMEDSLHRFWLPTNNGLFVVYRNEIKQHLVNPTVNPKYRFFTNKNFLPVNEFNGGVMNAGIVDSTHSFLFPTQHGILNINPYSISLENDPKPSIFLKKIYTNQHYKSITSESPITLNPDERNLRLHFGVFNLSNYSLTPQYSFSSDSTQEWNTLGADLSLTLNRDFSGFESIYLRFKEFGDNQPLFTYTFNFKPFYYETGYFYGLLVVIGIISLSFGIVNFKNKSKYRELRLQQEVDKRTLELQNQKKQTEEALETVRIKSAELELSNQYRLDVFRGLTHEFRTPLALIMGPLEILSETTQWNNPHMLQQQLNLMRENSLQLKTLVDRLLTLSKYGFNTDSIRLHPVLFNQILSTQISTYAPLAELKSILFETKLNVYNVEILGEETALELIVGNLLSNAVKFSPTGGRILLETYIDSTSLTLKVSDNGPGIPKSEQPLIFDAFFRGKFASDKEGSGIGLSLVKRLCDLMNATILVESSESVGTSFTLQWPIYRSTLSVQPNQNHVSDEQLINVKPFENKHILIVEDNADYRKLLQSSLSDLLSLHFAENGIVAKQLLQTKQFDLVLSDVMMPEMNGLELVKWMRQESSLKQIPIILLSAGSTNTEILAGLDSGAELYLTKPITLSNLKTQLFGLLRRTQLIQKQSIQTDSTFSDTIKSIEKYILNNLANSKLSVDSIAQEFNVSRASLYRKWNNEVPISINEYIIRLRIREVIALVRNHKVSLSEASLSCGFNDTTYFSRAFKQRFNLSPSEYLEKNQSNLPTLFF